MPTRRTISTSGAAFWILVIEVLNWETSSGMNSSPITSPPCCSMVFLNQSAVN